MTAKTDHLIILQIPAAICAEAEHAVEAIHRTFARHVYRAFFILIFAGAIALSDYLISAPSVQIHLTAPNLFVTALLFLTGLLGAYYAVIYFQPSKFLRMWINNQGIFYESEKFHHEVLWSRIEKGHGKFDVTAAISSNRKSMIWYFVVKPYKFMIQLTDFQPFPIGFQNSFALRRQILLNLALKDPALLFDPMVFVHAKVNPETWEPLPWMRKIYFVTLLAPISALAWLTYIFFENIDIPSEGWVLAILFLVTIFIVLPSIFLSDWLWSKFSPKWTKSTISFARPRQFQ